MQVLIVRHAIAGDKQRFSRTGKPDAVRPLTPEGVRKMKRNARGLRRLEQSVSLIATSPLLRARQTADLLERSWRAPLEEWPELAPDAGTADLVSRLAGQRGMKTVVLVGHDPHLTRAIGWLLCGSERGLLRLRKGGAVMLDFPRTVAKGQALLQWALTPRQLRAIR